LDLEDAVGIADIFFARSSLDSQENSCKESPVELMSSLPMKMDFFTVTWHHDLPRLASKTLPWREPIIRFTLMETEIESCCMLYHPHEDRRSRVQLDVCMVLNELLKSTRDPLDHLDRSFNFAVASLMAFHRGLLGN